MSLLLWHNLSRTHTKTHAHPLALSLFLSSSLSLARVFSGISSLLESPQCRTSAHAWGVGPLNLDYTTHCNPMNVSERTTHSTGAATAAFVWACFSMHTHKHARTHTHHTHTAHTHTHEGGPTVESGLRYIHTGALCFHKLDVRTHISD